MGAARHSRRGISGCAAVLRRLLAVSLVAIALPAIALPAIVPPAIAQDAPKDKKPAEKFNPDATTVYFRGLNKVTGRSSQFTGAVGKTVNFGTLEIRIRRCQLSRPTDPPERGAFLQIYEKSLKSDKVNRVFSGWMFSSNPALSAMEHPVYDVWITDCK